MIKKIMMPSGGQNSDESLLIKWYFEVGEKVSRGDILFDIETDKTTLEIESYASGYLLSKNCEEGTMVKEGEVVALIGDQKDIECVDNAKIVDTNHSSDSDEYQPIMVSIQEIKLEETKIGCSDNKQGLLIMASPLAKKMAREKGVALTEVVKGSSNKTIHVIDVINYIEKNLKENFEETIKENYTKIIHSNMRKIIANRMNFSLSTSAHYNIFTDIDMTKAIEVRNLLNGEINDQNVKISFNDMIIKCAAKAIKDIPAINSSFYEDHVKIWDDVNFGLAVSVENGIIVPVVRKCQNLSLPEIAKANLENVSSVKDGTINMNSLSGGTITLSSMGMFGVSRFTSIINQPESTILSIGSIEKRAVVINDKIEVKPMMTITSTFDHRGIDGATGAEFTNKLKKYLENPIILLT